MKALEEYQDETHRNLRKTQRRRERLEAIAKANGFETWYKMTTAIINAKEPITIKPI